jgi:hypothetical protein
VGTIGPRQQLRRWLTPAILATQVAEIRRIAVQSHPRQIARPYLKKKKKKKSHKIKINREVQRKIKKHPKQGTMS